MTAQHTYQHDYKPTHANRPASVRIAKAKSEEAWQEHIAICDELDALAERGIQADAHLYARLEHALQNALRADAEYSAICRAADHKAQRENELQAEAAINTDEAEPAADFDDLPDSSETTECDYEAMDRLAQSYPNRN